MPTGTPVTPQKHILIVSGKESVTRLFLNGSRFQDRFQGFSILKTGKGSEVIELAHKYPLALVMVADIRLLEVSGFELIRSLKADDKTKTVPIIVVTFLSRVAMEGDETEALQCGCDHYVGSPINGEELIHIIQSFMFQAST